MHRDKGRPGVPSRAGPGTEPVHRLHWGPRLLLLGWDTGAEGANRWENVAQLSDRDEVKFVLADRDDYAFARDAVARYHLTETCPVAFSPVWGRLAPAELAEWILADGLDVRLGLQLHKILWPDKDRGV